MKMKRIADSGLGMMVLLAGSVWAQNPPPTMYAESFRKGPTRVTEEKFEAKLNPENATYRERIRDSAGSERYELTVTPKGPEAETRITSWQVALRDLRHAIYGNLLQFDQELSEEPRDNLFWLNPIPSAPVPIRARRIIKVDGFYVGFQVKDLRFNPLDSPYLDSMTVQFEFANRDPRSQTQ